MELRQSTKGVKSNQLKIEIFNTLSSSAFRKTLKKNVCLKIKKIKKKVKKDNEDS